MLLGNSGAKLDAIAILDTEARECVRQRPPKGCHLSTLRSLTWLTTTRLLLVHIIFALAAWHASFDCTNMDIGSTRSCKKIRCRKNLHLSKHDAHENKTVFLSTWTYTIFWDICLNSTSSEAVLIIVKHATVTFTTDDCEFVVRVINVYETVSVAKRNCNPTACDQCSNGYFRCRYDMKNG